MPIRRKVILTILVATMSTLVAASTALCAFHWIYARKMITQDLRTQAEILAASSTAALSFRDKKAAGELLAAFRVRPHILGASLYSPDGTLLAHYGRLPARNSLPPDRGAYGVRFDRGDVELLAPVRMDQQMIGTVQLRFDYHSMRNELLKPYLPVLAIILPGSLLLAFLLSSFLQRVVCAPIHKLAATFRTVTGEKNYAVRAECGSRDELGLLTGAFNQMLARIEEDDSQLRDINRNLEREIAERRRAQAELETLHQRMLVVSRQAGMAEVATGVLHNVGNVLNSVNVSSTLVLDRLQQSRLANLAKAAGLLAEHPGDPAFLVSDPRGRRLPSYLVSLARILSEERALCIRELESLRVHIDHISEIIAMQQNYASVAGVVESVVVTSLIEDALTLNRGALARHQVRLERVYDASPLISVEKHKVLQILVNLIRNAKYALEEGGPPDKVLTLRTHANGDRRLRIEVADNGAGIQPENITRIFAHGFTTRPGGHGFGLHNSALTARQLGGTLHARSDGPGLGATFTLELPLSPEESP